jgi:HlyD family type I secretion membrane fusion protein
MWDSLLEHWRALAASTEAWYLEFFRAMGWVDPGQAGRIAAGATPFILLGGIAVLLWLALRRHRSRGSDGPSLAHLTRRPRRLGYAALLLLVVGFGGWSAIAPLASAAIAIGVVSPDGYRKTVQHLEGGIIRAIHVQEGDFVAAGQKLVTLEETQARANYEELRERYVYLLAMEARLIAEQTGAETIEFPAELTTLGTGEAQSVRSEEDLFLSRRASREGRERILAQRVKQLDEEIVGLHAVIAAESTQLELIEQEIAGVKELYDKGLERLPRLLALQRSQAAIRGEQASYRAQIARNKQQIGESEMQLLTMRQEDKEKINEDLTKVRSALAELRSQLPSRADVLTRTIIAAPIAGTVMNVRVTTESGVLRPGEPILDIVPVEAKLIIDARVKPIDIDTVQPGMKAHVLLTAYRQRNLLQIHGSLRSISADRLIDDRSGEAYFLAKVEVERAELARLKDVRLMPGMPAEVMILTGERTLLDYFLREFLESVTKSFRES